MRHSQQAGRAHDRCSRSSRADRHGFVQTSHHEGSLLGGWRRFDRRHALQIEVLWPRSGFGSRTSGSFSGSSSGFSSGGWANFSANSASLPCSAAISAQFSRGASAASLRPAVKRSIAAVEIFLQDLEQLQLGQHLVAVGARSLAARRPAAALFAAVALGSGSCLAKAVSNCASRSRAASWAALRRRCRSRGARAVRRRGSFAWPPRPAPG